MVKRLDTSSLLEWKNSQIFYRRIVMREEILRLIENKGRIDLKEAAVLL